MAKIPAQPEEIFEAFVEDYKKTFAAELTSVILYGSAARGEYIPKKSDINFMIVLGDEGIHRFGKALPLVGQWKKRMVSTPLFLTRGYISSSLDTFPIEFLNMQAAYRVVYGEDVLRDLVFDRRLVRLQCERELKGKLLQLRQSFLETEGGRRAVQMLITASLPTFFSIFQAVLFLRGSRPAVGKDRIVAGMAQEAGLDGALFLDLIAVREGRKKLSSADAVPIMENYIREIRKLALYIDQLQTQQGG
jgi:hypothetical protein